MVFFLLREPLSVMKKPNKSMISFAKGVDDTHLKYETKILMDHIEQDMTQIIQQYQEAFNIYYVSDTMPSILHWNCQVLTITLWDNIIIIILKLKKTISPGKKNILLKDIKLLNDKTRIQIQRVWLQSLRCIYSDDVMVPQTNVVRSKT